MSETDKACDECGWIHSGAEHPPRESWRSWEQRAREAEAVIAEMGAQRRERAIQTSERVEDPADADQMVRASDRKGEIPKPRVATTAGRPDTPKRESLPPTPEAPNATASESIDYECDACSAKPGSPTLCEICLARMARSKNWGGPRPAAPSSSVSRDEWTCGYACAIATEHRRNHDTRTLGRHLISEGLTLTKLTAAGVDDYDMRELLVCLAAADGSSASEKT